MLHAETVRTCDVMCRYRYRDMPGISGSLSETYFKSHSSDIHTKHHDQHCFKQFGFCSNKSSTGSYGTLCDFISINDFIIQWIKVSFKKTLKDSYRHDYRKKIIICNFQGRLAKNFIPQGNWLLGHLVLRWCVHLVTGVLYYSVSNRFWESK